MKKVLLTILLITLTLTTCTPVFAGVFGNASNWLLENAIGVVLTSIFVLIGGFFGGTAWGKAILKAKLPINELKDVVLKVREARRANSRGGRSITPEENAEILKEVEELIASVVAVFGKGK